MADRVRLGTVSDILTGFPFKSEEFTISNEDPYLLRGDNIGQGVLRWEGAKHWPARKSEATSPYWLAEDDIVVAMDRPWIEAGLKFAAVRQSDLPALLVQRVARLRGTRKLDVRFLRYVVAGKAFTDYILGVQTGTAVPHISRSQIEAFEFNVPPLPEQRVIASILGALDDKIELNRKMSATLEAVARALFKSWFVDFDPVRAKADGRDPGLPAEIAALFPDSFAETADGQLPSGWRVDSFRNAIQIFDSKRIPLSGRERAARTGPYPYYGAASVMDYIDDFIFSGVHLLIGEDGSVVRDDGTPVLQYIWGEFWVNNHAHVVVGDGAVSTEQIYMFLQQTNIRPYVTGAVQPKLNQGNLFRVPFLRAPDSVLCCFAEIVSPLFERIRLSFGESRTLTALRDALLPKLISGELRVGDAERVLAALA